MFSLAKAVARVVEGAVDALWVHWRVLSPMMAGKGREGHAMVDPEALVLASLALADHERRLERVPLAWWAHAGATLLSVQRMKNLAKDHPPVVMERMAGFARTAIESGDLRWKSVADGGRGLKVRAKDESSKPGAEDPRALMLRLRLGFGVGIKADVIGYLIGAMVAKTIPAIARETGYHQRAVRRAVEELAAGRFVESVSSAPTSYRVDLAAWRPLVELEKDPPPWRGWHHFYSFVTQLRHWADQQEAAGPSAYVLSSRARDFMEWQRPRLPLRLPSDRGASGEEYLVAFEESLEGVVDWMKSCA